MSMFKVGSTVHVGRIALSLEIEGGYLCAYFYCLMWRVVCATYRHIRAALCCVERVREFSVTFSV